MIWWAVPVLVLLVVTPAVYVALFEVHARTFRNEAFGAYIRMADGLRWAVAAVFVYFAFTVTAALLTGSMAGMVRAPLADDSLVEWLRLCLADLAFFAHWRASIGMVRIVEPHAGWWPLRPHKASA